jgi:hypothetical protein
MASHPPPSFHTSPPSHCRHTTQHSRHPKKTPPTVHFAASTVDVLSALAHRIHRPDSTRPSPPHYRPILKHSESSMTFLRDSRERFSNLLRAFGRWCHGVTSKNPNLRSDMYKNLIAQLRGGYRQPQMIAERVLYNNLNGFWATLVDDFNMIREEYSEQELIL